MWETTKTDLRHKFRKGRDVTDKQDTSIHRSCNGSAKTEKSWNGVQVSFSNSIVWKDEFQMGRCGCDQANVQICVSWEWRKWQVTHYPGSFSHHRNVSSSHSAATLAEQNLFLPYGKWSKSCLVFKTRTKFPTLLLLQNRGKDGRVSLGLGQAGWWEELVVTSQIVIVDREAQKLVFFFYSKCYQIVNNINHQFSFCLENITVYLSSQRYPVSLCSLQHQQLLRDD